MIDLFGFFEANCIAKTFSQTLIGTTRYFRISLNQIMADRAKEKEKIPDETPQQKGAQMQEWGCVEVASNEKAPQRQGVFEVVFLGCT